MTRHRDCVCSSSKYYERFRKHPRKICLSIGSIWQADYCHKVVSRVCVSLREMKMGGHETLLQSNESSGDYALDVD